MPSSRNTAEFIIRPMVASDLAALEPWLEVPRVRRWFDDPDYMTDLKDDMSDDRIRQWIVEDDGTAVAYLQDYDIHGWQDHPLGFLPQGARGMDTFVFGEERMGQGLAARYLRQHCLALFSEGCPALGIDPHPSNAAAIRCYEKVGFVAGTEADTDWGRVLKMSLHPKAVRT
ncbi:MAG: GNAT family N-acetyltransferase [Pseudomonadota bacterium]